jgi:hypothetical protein
LTILESLNNMANINFTKLESFRNSGICGLVFTFSHKCWWLLKDLLFYFQISTFYSANIFFHKKEFSLVKSLNFDHHVHKLVAPIMKKVNCFSFWIRWRVVKGFKSMNWTDFRYSSFKGVSFGLKIGQEPLIIVRVFNL